MNSLVNFCFRKIKTHLCIGLRSLDGLLSASPPPAWWQSWHSHLYTDGYSRWKSGCLPWVSSSLAKAISIFSSVLSPHHCLSEKTQVGCSDIVSLISFRVVITEHRVQQGRKLQTIRTVWERVVLTSCASSHLSRFSSISRLLTVCTKFYEIKMTFFSITQVHMVVFLKYV